MSLDQLPALALFMTMVLAICVYGFAVAGHFPAEFRGKALEGATGIAVLGGTMFVTVLSIVVAVYFALHALPWYAAVIGGGFMALGAPMLCLPLSDRIVNSRAILLVLAATTLLLSVAALCTLQR